MDTKLQQLIKLHKYFHVKGSLTGKITVALYTWDQQQSDAFSRHHSENWTRRHDKVVIPNVLRLSLLSFYLLLYLAHTGCTYSQ